MLRFTVEPDERLRADTVLQKFIEYRFKSLEERLDRMSDAFDRLGGVIISKAAFDELSGDVVRAQESLDKADERIRNLEEKVRLGRLVIIGIAIVLGPLVVSKLQELFA
jgi:hypothetical protein